KNGIRDFHVTGVQTCALPIYGRPDLREPVEVVGAAGGAPQVVGELERVGQGVDLVLALPDPRRLALRPARAVPVPRARRSIVERDRQSVVLGRKGGCVVLMCG